MRVGDVRSWHLTDISRQPEHVRLEGRSGPSPSDDTTSAYARGRHEFWSASIKMRGAWKAKSFARTQMPRRRPRRTAGRRLCQAGTARFPPSPARKPQQPGNRRPIGKCGSSASVGGKSRGERFLGRPDPQTLLAAGSTPSLPVQPTPSERHDQQHDDSDDQHFGGAIAAVRRNAK